MNDFNVLGTDLFGDPVKPKNQGPVADRFVIPPFTILDAKQGDWQERKRAWLSMGIKGELGRKCENGVGSHCLNNPDNISMSLHSETVKRMMAVSDGASPFDPVVCELAYSWFCPDNGQIIDPFAGGSVRGIVAKSLDKKYWGCDLRKEQIEANIKQAEEIFDSYDGESLDMFGNPDLYWLSGDSLDMLDTAPEADFLFTCPPYGDLEVYSDNPDDLSNMDHHAFIAKYKRIILKASKKLKDNTFACVVVGDFRDKKGFYRNFVSDTINAFEECGLRLYNEAILATSVGSACMRVTKQFNSGRKMVKTHQNILVFVKGDPRKAADKCVKNK